MRPVPLRHLLAIAIAITCTGLTISNYSPEVSRQDAQSGMVEFGAPPPPVGAFPETILATPGCLAAIPLMIVAGVFESSWPMQFAIVFGATFFWYCVGWYIDCVTGAVERDTPPRFVLIHFSALRIASAALFPLFLLQGFRVGDYFCAVGKPPFCSEILMYGIAMVWITIGTWFALHKFRESHTNRPSCLFAK
jgi:hypothetical protein